MELLKPLTFSILVALSMVFFFITVSAYSYRKDKSFFGGANIIGGWWLIHPYGSDGVESEARNLVFWGRLVFTGILI